VKPYKVVITPAAEASVSEFFLYVFSESPPRAERWIRRLYSAIQSLERFPERCSFAREREYIEEDLRQLLFGSNRIVFSIDEGTRSVFVHEVRHSKRRAVGEPISEDEETA
jgi:plasmid stabilization system protein ParE